MKHDAAAEAGLTTILVAENAIQQALAESALREANVAFVTKNDPTQHLLGAGQVGGLNLVAGPPTLQVAEADAPRAAQVLREALAEAEPTVGLDSDDYSAAEVLAIRYSRYSVVWAVLHFWGIGSLLALYFGVKSFKVSPVAPLRYRVLAVAGIAAGLAGAWTAVVSWWVSRFVP